MEEKKKFDFNTFIGLLLIGGIILYMLNLNQDNETKKQEESAKQTEQVDERVSDDAQVSSQEESTRDSLAKTSIDSAALAQKNEALGAFSYSASLPSAQDETTTLENDLLKIKVSNKGGQIVEARLKDITSHDSLPVYLVKDDNSSFNINFLTTKNKTLNTKELYFQPELSQNGETTRLSMKLKAADDQYLEYVYTLKPDEYMLDFTINSQGLNQIINQAQNPELNWKLKGYRHGKSVSFENRYTESIWHYKDNKNSSRRTDGSDQEEDISWIAYRQHFFTSILLTNTPFENGQMELEDISKDSDSLFSKAFTSTVPLQLKGGELQENMNFYYGPSDYKILNEYDRNLNEIIPMGWGIFGWINHYIFLPALTFFLNHLPAGIAIILLTIIIKLLLSPVQYKQYLSQAKQKVLRPEIEEINKKHEDNQMKRQQETMKLNRKAGINPASGCLVGIIQIPIFIALFRLFPSIFSLRHESFLWANDLSSYDVIAQLPFKIPFYGSHVSLFPILASAAIFVYMTLNMSTQNMPQQKGMPNMKYIMYISPVFMLFFFNSYPSALSLYYLTSNLISIGIVLVIKTYIIDEDKIHAKIQENKKKKPKKKNRFQRKMQNMMEEAERQQKLKK